MTEAAGECCIFAALLWWLRGGEGDVPLPVLRTLAVESSLGTYSRDNCNVDLMQWTSLVGFF